MCLLAVSLNESLIVAANRDEFRGRPSAAPQILEPGIIGGKDLESGGTWLGINDRGLFVAVTNRRTPSLRAYSRGLLTLEALRCASLREVQELVLARVRERTMAGFNLLAVRGSQGVCIHFDGEVRPQPFGPGLHVVSSDRDLDDPSMPELQIVKKSWAEDEAALKRLVASHEGDRPICKHGEKYGTVSSTLYWESSGRLLHSGGLPCRNAFEDYSSLVTPS
jgi:uncharacterized protein with NRDE domain